MSTSAFEVMSTSDEHFGNNQHIDKSTGSKKKKNKSEKHNNTHDKKYTHNANSLTLILQMSPILCLGIADG